MKLSSRLLTLVLLAACGERSDLTVAGETRPQVTATQTQTQADPVVLQAKSPDGWNALPLPDTTRTCSPITANNKHLYVGNCDFPVEVGVGVLVWNGLHGKPVRLPEPDSPSAGVFFTDTYATGMNDDGIIVGYAEETDITGVQLGVQVAVRWDPKKNGTWKVSVIASPDPSLQIAAQSITEAGDIAITAMDGPLYAAGTQFAAYVLTASGSWILLQPLSTTFIYQFLLFDGADTGVCYQCNHLFRAAGIVTVSVPGFTGNGFYDVNRAGRIVGYAYQGNAQRAYVYDNVNGAYSPTALATVLSSSEISLASAINKHGLIVGTSQSVDATAQNVHLVAWTAASEGVDLGATPTRINGQADPTSLNLFPTKVLDDGTIFVSQRGNDNAVLPFVITLAKNL